MSFMGSVRMCAALAVTLAVDTEGARDGPLAFSDPAPPEERAIVIQPCVRSLELGAERGPWDDCPRLGRIPIDGRSEAVRIHRTVAGVANW